VAAWISDPATIGYRIRKGRQRCRPFFFGTLPHTIEELMENAISGAREVMPRSNLQVGQSHNWNNFRNPPEPSFRPRIIPVSKAVQKTAEDKRKPPALSQVPEAFLSSASGKALISFKYFAVSAEPKGDRSVSLPVISTSREMRKW
jgi:hypothetical protein